MAKSDKRVSALDRLIQEAAGDGKVLGRDDDPAAKEFPDLWQWLATVYVGRDHIKQPSTITIRLGPGGVLASLVDRDLSVSVDATCPHLAGVFTALQQALTGDAPPVKSWGRREPHLRKRRNGQ